MEDQALQLQVVETDAKPELAKAKKGKPGVKAKKEAKPQEPKADKIQLEEPQTPEAKGDEKPEETKAAQPKTPSLKKKKIGGYHVYLKEGRVYGVGNRTFRADHKHFVNANETWLLKQLLTNGRFKCVPLEV